MVVQRASRTEHQSGRNEILYADARVRTCYADQKFNIIDQKRNKNRRRYRHQWKHDTIDKPVVRPIATMKQNLDIIAQRYSNNWEISAQREYRK